MDAGISWVGAEWIPTVIQSGGGECQNLGASSSFLVRMRGGQIHTENIF